MELSGVSMGPECLGCRAPWSLWGLLGVGVLHGEVGFEGWEKFLWWERRAKVILSREISLKGWGGRTEGGLDWGSPWFGKHRKVLP